MVRKALPPRAIFPEGEQDRRVGLIATAISGSSVVAIKTSFGATSPSKSPVGHLVVAQAPDTNNSSQARKETQMKRATLITGAVLGIASILLAQQQQYRREHMICPIDGARMDWTGNQQGTGNNASCEFSHVAYTADHQRADHKAWASCSEWR